MKYQVLLMFAKDKLVMYRSRVLTREAQLLLRSIAYVELATGLRKLRRERLCEAWTASDGGGLEH